MRSSEVTADRATTHARENFILTYRGHRRLGQPVPVRFCYQERFHSLANCPD